MEIKGIKGYLENNYKIFKSEIIGSDVKCPWAVVKQVKTCKITGMALYNNPGSVPEVEWTVAGCGSGDVESPE